MIEHPILIICFLLLAIVVLVINLLAVCNERNASRKAHAEAEEVAHKAAQDVMHMRGKLSSTLADVERVKETAAEVQSRLHADLRSSRRTNAQLSDELTAIKRTPAKPHWPHRIKPSL